MKLTVLNSSIPIIETYQADDSSIRYVSGEQPTSGLAVLQDSGLLSGNIWYCMFTTATSFKQFSLREVMGEDIYQQVINKTASIVLDLSFEPFLRSIDSIYEDVVIKYNIPSEQVVFLSNMYDAAEYNRHAAIRYNCTPISVFWFSALEFMLQDYRDAIPNTLQSKVYDKKFLNLNRRWRSHRPLLTLLLYHKNLLSNGLVSFGPCGETFNSWESIWDGLKVGAIGNIEIFTAIVQSESIKNMPALYLDTDQLHINRAELTTSTNRYYEDSYFSVVSETTFYNRETHLNSRFITEKTFKAIMMNHPFILVSIPNSLEILKKLGYKTFDPWINESYDLEYDDNKRMMMIVNEIERLCNLSSSDLNAFLVAAKEICSYNYNIIRNKKQFIYRESNV